MLPRTTSIWQRDSQPNASGIPGAVHYDADRLRRLTRDAGAVLVIPGRRNCKRAIRYDKNRYTGRYLIESAFCRLKDFRRAATRYDNLAANSLSGVALATAMVFGSK